MKKRLFLISLIILIVSCIGFITNITFKKDIEVISRLKEKDNRYLNYLPFNENIITNEIFNLYDDDKIIYTIESSMEFPIIIKDYENKYYVIYNEQLLSIRKDDIKEIIQSNNTNKSNQGSITTLLYHQIINDDDSCDNLYVCIKKSDFDKEMKYLSDNNYFTLTMEELYMYLKGNLQIEKGVVLTFDDGYNIKNGIEILEKYNLYGTLFVITSSFNDYSIFNSNNLFLQSHGDNLHRNNVCKGGYQGGVMLCMKEEDIKNDLLISIDKLKTKPLAFAYPFYDYNEKAINVVSEIFKMSFIGRNKVMGKSTPLKTNLYKIPRMTVWDTSLMDFNIWKSYV